MEYHHVVGYKIGHLDPGLVSVPDHVRTDYALCSQSFAKIGTCMQAVCGLSRRLKRTCYNDNWSILTNH